MKIRARGPVITCSLEWDNFLKHAKSIVHTIKDIPDETLRMQYRSFLNRMNAHYNDIKKDDLNNLTSIDIIRKFLTSKLKMFDGIELIIHIICAASVAMSVESIVESMVSMYEIRQSKLRNTGEDHGNEEMMIAVNGPEIANADKILKKSLDSYFKKHKEGKWHFTMDPTKITYTISKTVDSLKSKSSRFAFMDTD
jgi:hypothetical protein